MLSQKNLASGTSVVLIYLSVIDIAYGLKVLKADDKDIPRRRYNFAPVPQHRSAVQVSLDPVVPGDLDLGDVVSRSKALPMDDVEEKTHTSGENIKILLEEKYKFVNDKRTKRYNKIANLEGMMPALPDKHEDPQLTWAFRSYAVRRIVGGMETSISMYPYNVAISRNGKHWCGGSIIDEQWVLTAGHCLESAVDGDKKKLTPFIVRAGSSFHNRGGYQARVNKLGSLLTYIPDDLKLFAAHVTLVFPATPLVAASKFVPTPGTKPSVTVKVFFPKEYAAGSADFDFSLLRLDRPMPIGRNIAVLNLPSKDYIIKEDDILIVTGWGSTDESGYGHIPDRLRFVPVPVMRLDDCQKSYRFYITPRMLCAGYATGGKDACNHDSGGPAVRDGVLLGIVSFGGKQCGDPRSPGVYSRVSEVTDWVERTITNNEASSVPELKEKIRKARMRERELQKFKARVDDKKNKIKNWLRETLKSPTFLELAKKKLLQAGYATNTRRTEVNMTTVDDKTIDEINIANQINDLIIEDDRDDSEKLLSTLAVHQVMLASDKEHNSNNATVTEHAAVFRNTDEKVDRSIEALISYITEDA